VIEFNIHIKDDSGLIEVLKQLEDTGVSTLECKVKGVNIVDPVFELSPKKDKAVSAKVTLKEEEPEESASQGRSAEEVEEDSINEDTFNWVIEDPPDSVLRSKRAAWEKRAESPAKWDKLLVDYTSLDEDYDPKRIDDLMKQVRQRVRWAVEGNKAFSLKDLKVSIKPKYLRDQVEKFIKELDDDYTVSQENKHTAKKFVPKRAMKVLQRSSATTKSTPRT
jgi:hypothetical protein